MLSVHKVKVVGHAAAITTNAEVDSSIVSVPQTLDGKVRVNIDFTIGNLTNVKIRPYVSDGTDYYLVTDPGMATLTGTGKYSFLVDCSGAKLFKVTVEGTGTVTSSSVKVDFGWRIAGGAA